MTQQSTPPDPRIGLAGDSTDVDAAEYGDHPMTDVLIEMRQFIRTVESYPPTHEVRHRAPGWVEMIREWEQRMRKAMKP